METKKIKIDLNYYVKGCSDCPFQFNGGYSGEAEMCTISQDESGYSCVIDNYELLVEGYKPEWCKLQSQDVKVMIDK